MSRSATDAVIFDRALHIGQTVMAYWHHQGGHDYQMQATVVKLNAKSLKVALDEQIVTMDGTVVYPKGQIIHLPRMSSAQWHVSHRAMPLSPIPFEGATHADL